MKKKPSQKVNPFMAGPDRSGQGGGPTRAGKNTPVFKKTNVKYKPKKRGL